MPPAHPLQIKSDGRTSDVQAAGGPRGICGLRGAGRGVMASSAGTAAAVTTACGGAGKAGGASASAGAAHCMPQPAQQGQP